MVVVKVEGGEEEIDRVRPLVAAAAVRVFVFFSLLFPNNDLITFSSSLSLFHFFLFLSSFLSSFLLSHSLSLSLTLFSLTLSHSSFFHSHTLTLQTAVLSLVQINLVVKLVHHLICVSFKEEERNNVQSVPCVHPLVLI